MPSRTPPPCMSFGMENNRKVTFDMDKASNPFDSDDDMNLQEPSLYTHDVPLEGDPKQQSSYLEKPNYKCVPVRSKFQNLCNCTGPKVIYSLFGIITMSMLISAIVILFHFNHLTTGSSPKRSSSNVLNIGQDISFYLVSNMPHNSEDEKVISDSLKNLGNLPSETGEKGSFLVHLGDVGSSKHHRCAPFVYKTAKELFEICPVPFFIIPGNNDWNDCPYPKTAWQEWESSFGNHELEDKHHGVTNNDHSDVYGNNHGSVSVSHQEMREENFKFLDNGVLFIGIHLVDGQVPDWNAWNTRVDEDVIWTEGNIIQYQGQYRAVVIFGHSPPITLLDEYFLRIVNTWKDIQEKSDKVVPFLYAFANKFSDNLEVYTPRLWDTHMYVMENVRGGLVKVKIVSGEDPFIFEDLRYDHD